MQITQLHHPKRDVAYHEPLRCAARQDRVQTPVSLFCSDKQSPISVYAWRRLGRTLHLSQVGSDKKATASDIQSVKKR